MVLDTRTFIPGAAGPPLLPEQPVPRELQQRLLRDGIAPPSALWVDANDILTLKCRNSLASVSLQVSARLMEPDGRIITPAFTVAPATDRSIVTATQPLYEGYLLSATVQAIGATLPRRGQTYCVLRVDRMPAPSNLIHRLLGADYVSGTFALEWPYGRVVAPTEGPGVFLSIGQGAPGAGVDVTINVPTNARWRIRGTNLQLVTAVAAGVRQVRLVIDDGATIFYDIEAGATQGPSLTQIYDLVPGDTLTTLTATRIPIYIPLDLQLFSGWRLRTITDTIQAADQWTIGRIFVEEWLED